MFIMVEKVIVCKVLYDFDSAEPGELPLKEGQYIQLLDKVNDDWQRGYSDGCTGSFPAAFVQSFPQLTLPPKGKVFLCVEEFPLLQHGDLAINPGDLIVGLEAVNPDWWRGLLQGEVGIFPLTHVTEIKRQPTATPAAFKSSLKVTASAPTPSPVTSTKHSAPSSSGAQCLYRLRAVMDAQAQLDDELSFSIGDIIEVTKEEDSDWLIGRCNGATGMFLRDLTEPFDTGGGSVKSAAPAEDTTPKLTKIEKHTYPSAESNDTDKQDQYSNHVSPTIGSSTQHKVSNTLNDKSTNNIPFSTLSGTVLYDFQAETTSELSLKEGHIVTDIQVIDDDWWSGTLNGATGMFPKVFVELLDSSTSQQQSDNSLVTQTSSSLPAATVLYSFTAVNPEEISLSEGQKVTVISESVDDWTKVRAATGEEGLCPSDFLDPPPVSSHDTALVPVVSTSLTNGVTMRSKPTGSKHRSASLLSEHSLDDAITSEMTKAKSEAERRRSLQPKPVKPPSPVKHLLTQTAPLPIQFQSNKSISELSPHISTNGANTTAVRPARPLSKPVRPPVSAQMTVRRSVDQGNPTSSSPYDNVNQPHESLFEWKDQNPSPVINVRQQSEPSKKPPPVKPPQPKKSNSSSDLPHVSTNNTDAVSNIPHSQSQQSITRHTAQAEPESAGRPVRQPPAKPSKPPQPQQGQEWIINSEVANGDSSAKLSAEPIQEPNKPVTITTAESDHNNHSSEDNLESKQLQEKTVSDSQASKTDNTSGNSSPKPVRAAPPIPGRPAPTPPSVAPHRPVPSRPTPSRPAPSRPAPSRPAPTRPAPARPGPSPQVHQIIEEPTALYDAQAADSLRHRITVLDNDIERYNDEVENLDGQSVDDDVLDDKLRFYMENINGMTLEVDELRAQLTEMEALPREHSTMRTSPKPLVDDFNSPEKIEKRKTKRINKIEEVIKTEEHYLRDLNLCMQVFYSDQGEQGPEEIDKQTMFCNMADVIRISQDLLSRLEALRGVEFDQQIVGEPFIELKEEMKYVYALYCKNYDDVTNLLEQYKTNEEVQSYFARGLDEISKHRPEKPFTIGAFLITPVQRIPRYILLLSELYEATEASHPDKVQLESAKKAQGEVAEFTNEYKRRKDIVNKYKEEREDDDKLSKLTMHSFKKKTKRISMRIGNYVGLASQYVDEGFDKETRAFNRLEVSIREFSKNVDTFMAHLRSSHDGKELVATDLSDYLSAKQTSDFQTYLDAQQNLSTSAYRQFREGVDIQVTNPLMKLLVLFQGPCKLIEKRGDKRLDYDSAQNKYEKNKEDKIAGDELNKTAKDFHALNTQLKEELPRFNTLVCDIFRECVSQFTELYRNYYHESYKFILPMMQLPSMDASNPVLTQFEKEHALVSEILTSIGDIKSRKTSAASSMFSSAQTDIIQQQLRSKYDLTKLYTVTTAHKSANSMDITVSQSDLVGVIQQKNPMGDETSWFIDNGVSKGFIPKTCLQHFNTTNLEPPTSQHTTTARRTSISPHTSPQMRTRQPHNQQTHQQNKQTHQQQNQHSPQQQHQQSQQPHQQWSPPPAYQQQAPTSAQQSPPPRYDLSAAQLPEHQEQQEVEATAQKQSYEVFRALYDFSKRNANEISLVANQIIHVHRKYDEQGNPEWWYCESNEGFGYSPANYLTPNS